MPKKIRVLKDAKLIGLEIGDEFTLRPDGSIDVYSDLCVACFSKRDVERAIEKGIFKFIDEKKTLKEKLKSCKNDEERVEICRKHFLKALPESPQCDSILNHGKYIGIENCRKAIQEVE